MKKNSPTLKTIFLHTNTDTYKETLHGYLSKKINKKNNSFSCERILMRYYYSFTSVLQASHIYLVCFFVFFISSMEYK